jgi:hypothetical protein
MSSRWGGFLQKKNNGASVTERQEVSFISTTLLLFSFILPADAPASVSTEMHESTLAELLSGSWSSNWAREGQTEAGAAVHKGMFTLPMTPPAKMRLTITEEGRGWYRGKVGDAPVVGIWRFKRGVLFICSNGADKGFPRRFEDGQQRDVVTLWMR